MTVVGNQDDQKPEEAGTATEADVEGVVEAMWGDGKETSSGKDLSTEDSQDDEAIRRRQARFGTSVALPSGNDSNSAFNHDTTNATDNDSAIWSSSSSR